MVTEIKVLTFVGSQGTFHVEFEFFSPCDYIRELFCSLFLVHDAMYGKMSGSTLSKILVCGCSVLRSTTSKP